MKSEILEEYELLPLDGMLVSITGLPPVLNLPMPTIQLYTIDPRGKRHCESKMSCPRKQLWPWSGSEPRPLNLQLSALIMRPLYHPNYVWLHKNARKVSTPLLLVSATVSYTEVKCSKGLRTYLIYSIYKFVSKNQKSVSDLNKDIPVRRCSNNVTWWQANLQKYYKLLCKYFLTSVLKCI